MRAHGNNDSPFHIASILGISIEDWDILAPFSGLFDSSNRIQTNTWVRKLLLEVKFEDFYTVSANGDAEHWKWFRFVGLPRTGDLRTSRSNPMIPIDKLAEN